MSEELFLTSEAGTPETVYVNLVKYTRSAPLRVFQKGDLVICIDKASGSNYPGDVCFIGNTDARGDYETCCVYVGSKSESVLAERLWLVKDQVECWRRITWLELAYLKGEQPV